MSETLLDGHIHKISLTDTRSEFRQRMACAKARGGTVISLPPPAYRSAAGQSEIPAETRLDDVLAWCAGEPELFPFFWIDPLEEGADEQVALATERGIRGFKIICDRFHPGDKRVLDIVALVARARQPILFHAGILWDGKPSSRFNRPAEFEPLLEVDGLRFALAHMAWPWCDELIAVYGKFLNARASGNERGVEMFVDTTPGTPPVYRREALTKLFGVGYDIRHNVVFGSDSDTGAYNAEWVRQWTERDTAILSEAGLNDEDLRLYFSGNLLRFLDSSAARPAASLPRVAT